MSNIIDDEDKIIFIDESFIQKNNLDNNFILMYELGYQLYNCDGIIIDNNKYNNLYWDNYNNYLNIKNSYSFKFKSIKNIKIDNFVDTLDIHLYKYYKLNKLYLCGLNLYECDDINNNIDIDIDIDSKERFLNIQSNIQPRYLLYNVKNINYEPTYNDYQNKHIDIKYYNTNIILVTITYFNINNDNNDKIKLDDIIYEYKYNNNSKKITIIIYTDKKIEYIDNINNNYYNSVNDILNNTDDNKYINFYNNNKYSIFQINKTNNICINKFYSIMTILNNIPHIEYKFYSNNDIYNLINNSNLINTLYNKVNDVTSKLDLFKAWYLYNFGGLYFNCKNILYSHIDDLLKLDEFYVSSLKNDIYTNLLFSKNKYNNNIKKYLINICYNILTSFYGNNYLSITSNELLSKIITNNDIIKLNMKIDESLNSNNYENINILKDNKILIKLSYLNYYNNIESIINLSYNLWKNNCLYNQLKINYGNINGIDYIVWINLDRSTNRRDNMMKILNNLDIPNSRISAIDGSIIDLSSITNLEAPLTNYEKACVLSHIKAISYLENIDGNYFLILEDDITLNNTTLFNIDLKHIIENAPNFDILLLGKIIPVSNNSFIEINNLYLKWTEGIYSTMSYIISREGINKIINFAKYNFNTNNFNINNNLNIADTYIYKIVNTYVYKYNYITSLDNESTIHPEHLDNHKLSSLNQLQIILNDLINI
jgi:GR25 family glycosyltransferase involved in LPS biosynthesis